MHIHKLYAIVWTLIIFDLQEIVIICL